MLPFVRVTMHVKHGDDHDHLCLQNEVYGIRETSVDSTSDAVADLRKLCGVSRDAFEKCAEF